MNWKPRPLATLDKIKSRSCHCPGHKPGASFTDQRTFLGNSHDDMMNQGDPQCKF